MSPALHEVRQVIDGHVAEVLNPEAVRMAQATAEFASTKEKACLLFAWLMTMPDAPPAAWQWVAERKKRDSDGEWTTTEIIGSELFVRQVCMARMTRLPNFLYRAVKQPPTAPQEKSE